jgi:DNA processing protein
MGKINTISANHKLFQQRLSQLADPPERLYYTGVVYTHTQPCLTIVGSRKPTPYGKDLTYQLAYELARQGVVIVSGLALGIDGIAHQAALDAGGTTVGVLAGGLDNIYPYRHRKLARQIIDNGGLLLSEYPPGTSCYRHQFIARNRIEAALGEGLLVTEAAAKSGTLHTAGFALDLGRVVMALPGQATNPMAAGCLNLLKTGATLITNVDDILFALNWKKINAQQELPLLADSEAERIILTLLSQGVQDGEILLQKSNLAPHIFNQHMSMLEIKGQIMTQGANMWSLR